jgi:hypothetical protein
MEISTLIPEDTIGSGAIPEKGVSGKLVLIPELTAEATALVES